MWYYFVAVALFCINVSILVEGLFKTIESHRIVKKIKKRKDENDRKSIQRDNR